MDFARQLRLAKGLSQGEAAQHYGVSQATVSAIERGERPARVYRDYVMRLATSPNSKKRTAGGDDRVGRVVPKRRTKA
ncbi:MAG: helix-turn-helix domain-containing protein [Candidatus Eremiobacteraeota bacterium]|nr:helix-turn-helix domain-containing protein [Candidatus Eremiobacteraeota bacterium]